MQVETGLPKWSGRVPPLDLTSVSVCPRETEKRWHKIQPISKKNSDCRIGTDGLPVGKSIEIHCLSLYPRIDENKKIKLLANRS